MQSGAVVVTYTDGTEETCRADDLFFWPAGHSVRVVEDAELILFSPQVAHLEVMEHMRQVMAAAPAQASVHHHSGVDLSRPVSDHRLHVPARRHRTTTCRRR